MRRLAIALSLFAATAAAEPSKLQEGDPRLDRLIAQNWRGRIEQKVPDPAHENWVKTIIIEVQVKLARDASDGVTGEANESAVLLDGKTAHAKIKLAGKLVRKDNRVQLHADLVSGDGASWNPSCEESLTFFEDKKEFHGYILRGEINCNGQRDTLELLARMD